MMFRLYPQVKRMTGGIFACTPDKSVNRKLAHTRGIENDRTPAVVDVRGCFYFLRSVSSGSRGAAGLSMLLIAPDIFSNRW